MLYSRIIIIVGRFVVSAVNFFFQLIEISWDFIKTNERRTREIASRLARLFKVYGQLLFRVIRVCIVTSWKMCNRASFSQWHYVISTPLLLRHRQRLNLIDLQIIIYMMLIKYFVTTHNVFCTFIIITREIRLENVKTLWNFGNVRII